MNQHLYHQDDRFNNLVLRTTCPQCRVLLDDLREDIQQWDQVVCPKCGVLLELAGWRPLTFNVVDADDEISYDDISDYEAYYFGITPWDYWF